MSKTVVRVQHLAKRYRLASARTQRHLHEALFETAREAWGRLKRLGSSSEPETFWALDDVSFDVGTGEVLGIIGKNGAGKSTLLKVLSRITEPTSGRIELRGRVASLLEVGTGFHAELSGRENIYLNGTFLGMRKREIDRKFDEIVAFAEVERFIDTPVKRYSSGMYVRLAFAVAAHLEPEILLVDEVLAVGDAEFQRRCLGKMNDIAEQGRTVLFVSHNMAAIQRLSSRALLLDKGRVTSMGGVASVVKDYLGGEERPRFLAERRTGRPQLLSVELARLDGTPLERPLSTEDFQIEVVYSLPEVTPGVRLGIGFLTVDGVPLFTSESRDEDIVLSSAKGVYRARIRIPGAMLLAGDFHVAACLMNDGEILELQEPALSFTVEPGPSPLYRSTSRRKGFVHLPCRWSVAEEEASSAPVDEVLESR